MSIDTDLASLEDPSSSYRIYIADSIGCLRYAQCSPPSALPKDYAGPSVRPLVLPNFKSHTDHAVQRLATGVLGSSTYVVAMARKNATIDVVRIVNQSLPSSSASPVEGELRAEIICTIKEDQMKAGIHRFIDLAVGAEGVYSVTSSGVFRFTPINVVSEAKVELGEATVLDNLPSPLQHASFYPTSNPTHFCYGGEDVPLSLWHLPSALSEPTQDVVGDMSVESVKTSPTAAAEDLSGLNSKQRKRKRQLEAKTKARELLHGEVWRAKNLPNDNLSLPRRANITSTCILTLASSDDGEAEEGSHIAVGTKDGLVRLFHPSTSRKHTKEIRIVPAGQGSVKTLCASSDPLNGQKGGLLFVGDTGSKVYAVDWVSGSVVYGYKGQTGATLSMAVLPRKDEKDEALASVSSDSLVRLHSTVPASKAVPEAGKSAAKGEVVWGKMMVREPSGSGVMASPTAVCWDGVVPEGGARGKVGDGEEEEEGEDEEVWERMQEVGRKGKDDRGNGKDEDGSEDDEDEDEDEEAQEEVVQKKNENGRRKGKPAPAKKGRK